MMQDLSARTRHILQLVVDSYVATGAPVGSKALSEKMGMTLSPATIRHAMAELEARGLLYAPHTSAGRLPTDSGLAVFVDGLLEVDRLSAAEQQKIRKHLDPLAAQPRHAALEQAGELLSGLASCAGLVFAPTGEDVVRQVEFLLLEPGRALAIIVTGAGQVENRLIEVPQDITATTLARAANYLNAHVAEKTLRQAVDAVRADMAGTRAQLDELTARAVQSGIAALAPEGSGAGHLIVRGQAKLLDDIAALADIERIRNLMAALDAKESLQKILEATTTGEGVKIFIGADNTLFSHAGCAMIVAPCRSEDARMVGAIGVIGPARLNYRRIIPVINYTSRLIGEIIK